VVRFAVDDALERRIRGEIDLDVLELWIRRAVGAANLDDVFA
jgi:hypothetical protein